MKKVSKQNVGKSEENPHQDGFNAEELGEQSIYEKETEIARRIRRGQAHTEQGDEVDVAGSPDSWGSAEKTELKQAGKDKSKR